MSPWEMELRESNIRKLNRGVHDVLIVGGGINGAVSAAALSAKGARVALIDRRDFAGFAARGLPVFSDDVVRVQVDAAGCLRVWPGYPGARLRGESFLLGASQRGQRPGRYGLPRFRVHTTPVVGVPAEGLEVAAVCFLGRSRTVAPSWARLSPMQAITPWVESCFLLSLPKPQRLRAAFERGSQLARSAPAWRVAYRRSSPHFATLCTRLVEAMEAIAASGTPHR